MLVEPGATIVMQLHYNLQNVPTALADQTEVQFQLSDTVSRRLAYQPMLDVVRFEPGDQLRVKCTFDNVEGRWGPGVAPMDTNWGESSTEEMCVANILSSE
ncbi:MAG: hypothetical protein AMXMBFR34_46130 [Myxococcaceae bacterium]